MQVASRILSRWYAQLAPALEAGLPLIEVLATTSGPPMVYRQRLRDELAAGAPIPEALEKGAAWLPEVDRELIAAGAAVGRLPDLMRRLGKRHEDATRASGRAMIAAVYPLFVAHFAVFVLSINLLIVGPGAGAYFDAVLQILLPGWMAVALIWCAVRMKFLPVIKMLDALPLVSGFRKYRALADLAFVLEAHVSAGSRLDTAWLQAARAAGSKPLQRVAQEVAETVKRGALVSTALQGRRELPAPFVEYYANGERTGQLDGNLNLLQRQFRDVSLRRLGTAAFVYPKLLFGFVAVWIAIKVITFYADYFKQFDEFM